MRGKQAAKRTWPPDPVYKSRLLTRFINRVMTGGKKSLAQKLVYQALEKIEKGTDQDPLNVFRKAVDNVKPGMEVRPRRVGGAAYQVPVPVKGDRKESLALRWLILAARARPNRQYHTFDQKLAAELLDASKGEGGAVKRKEDVHRMAEANRAFAHFRW
jgi:small subunit ribosomal protein S7